MIGMIEDVVDEDPVGVRVFHVGCCIHDGRNHHYHHCHRHQPLLPTLFALIEPSRFLAKEKGWAFSQIASTVAWLKGFWKSDHPPLLGTQHPQRREGMGRLQITS